jgi:pyruvate ferredoxin oxidoreductase gamma subunit
VLVLSPGEPGRADVAALGARCAGAAARLVGCIGRVAFERALAAELGKLEPSAFAASRRTALEAYDAMAAQAGRVEEGPDVPPGAGERPAWVELRAEPPALSAPDVAAAGSSAAVATGLWRTLRPVIDDSLCHRCAWICSTFCPDGAISIAADGRPSIDYDHCKGCLVCAAVCPPHAIRVEPERGARP